MQHTRRFLLAAAVAAMVAVGAACSGDAQATPISPAAPGGTTNPVPVSSTGFAAEVLAGLPRIAESTGYLSQQSGIWVTGTGSATVQPDLAILTVGVEARADTVEAARSSAARAMEGIVASLKANGVDEKDIQTRHLSISPQYTWRDRVDEKGSRYGEQVLTGYQVSNQATVKVRELTRAGEIVDGVAEAGGDLARVQGIQFTVDDPGPLHTLARELAVREAMAKASQFADLTGVTLGRLAFISELGSTPVARAYAAPEALAANAKATTPVSAGELEVQVSVQAVFAIQ